MINKYGWIVLVIILKLILFGCQPIDTEDPMVSVSFSVKAVNNTSFFFISYLLLLRMVCKRISFEPPVEKRLLSQAFNFLFAESPFGKN